MTQISGIAYIFCNYLLSVQLNKSKKKHYTLLFIFLTVYVEVTLLSIFKALNFWTLACLTLIKAVYLVASKSPMIKFTKIKKLNSEDLVVSLIYLVFLVCFQYTGFNFDDVLTTYIPRVEQWIQHQSIFITLEVSDYYNPILLYPQMAQAPIMIIEIFHLPVALYMFFSLFTTHQIFLSLKDFYELNSLESKATKIALFLSPIVLILSTSGLTDLFFTYFLINAFLTTLIYLKSGTKKKLIYALLFTVFSISIRYHGIFVLFIVGLLLLNTRKVKTYLESSFYTLLFILIFIFPNLLWLYVKGYTDSFTSTFFKQFGQNSKRNEIFFGDNEILEILLFSSESALLRTINLFSSITHTVINYTFTDFPGLLFLTGIDNYFTYNLYKYNVFFKSADVRTTGTIVFFFSITGLMHIFLEASKKRTANGNSDFSKKFVAVYKLVRGFLLLLIPLSLYTLLTIARKNSYNNSFFVFLCIFLILASYLLMKKTKMASYDNNTSYLILGFITIIYFFLISLRDFTDSNLRYLFPVIILIFPLGVKVLSHHLEKKLIMFSMLAFTSLSGIQSLLLSEMLLADNYPDFRFQQSYPEKSTRGWYPIEYRQNINQSLLNFNKVSQELDSNTVLLILEQKFPISLLDSENILFRNLPIDEILDDALFKKNNVSILFTDQRNIKYDSSVISYVDSSYKNIKEQITTPYVLFYFNNNSYLYMNNSE